MLSNLRKHEAPTEELALAGRNAHTLKKVRLAVEELTFGKKVDHKPTVQHVRHRDRRVSPSPHVCIIHRGLGVKCLKRCYEHEHHAFITPDFGHRKAMASIKLTTRNTA